MDEADWVGIILASDLSPYKPMVELDGNDNCFVFANSSTSQEFLYRIDSCRAKDYQSILGWVLHLSSKEWFTSRHAKDFIQAACESHGIDHPEICQDLA